MCALGNGLQPYSWLLAELLWSPGFLSNEIRVVSDLSFVLTFIHLC